MLSQKDMTEAITAKMEKRDASFDDMVDVKKFNESNSQDFLRNTGTVAVDSDFEYLYPSKSNPDKSSKLVTLF